MGFGGGGEEVERVSVVRRWICLDWDGHWDGIGMLNEG